MSRFPTTLALLTATLTAGLLVAPAVPAYVAPGAFLISASTELREQGDDASGQPDLSSDGRYVVFTTSARNLFPPDVQDSASTFYEGGVFRRDTRTGALELVALGSERSTLGSALVRRGAGNPSISGDGRWVVFSTGAALVPEDTNQHIDVYVRDMLGARSDPQAYELISARDGTNAQARFEARTPPAPFRDPGADVAPGAAISDDGRTVVFEVAAVATDLPDRGGLDVPAGQVFVRDRLTRSTRLVTRVAGAPGQPITAAGGPVGVGPAVISADGSTVAWAGQQAQQQTPFLAGEGQSGDVYFYLWQRLADGPDAPTRRITGAVDLDDPACAGDYVPSGARQGPCYGPLADTEQGLSGIAATPPALSGDGRRVAFLTQSAPRGQEAVAAVDVFVTDMSPGVSRKAGTLELTREGTSRDPVASSSISSVALSADGRWAALVTPRTRFLLPALRLAGDARAVPGPNELYLADLVDGTTERVVRGLSGADAGDAVATQVALSGDGRRVAFASAAENLFFGDANQRADVFALERLDSAPVPPVEVDPPAEAPAEALDPPQPTVKRLTVYVRRAPRGRIRLDVRAPVRGRIVVTVRGRLPDADGRLRGAVRTLASARKTVKKAGRTTVDVVLAKRYRTRLSQHSTLDARAAVVLTPASGAPLQRELTVRFSAPAKRKKPKSG